MFFWHCSLKKIDLLTQFSFAFAHAIFFSSWPKTNTEYPKPGMSLDLDLNPELESHQLGLTVNQNTKSPSWILNQNTIIPWWILSQNLIATVWIMNWNPLSPGTTLWLSLSLSHFDLSALVSGTRIPCYHVCLSVIYLLSTIYNSFGFVNKTKSININPICGRWKKYESAWDSNHWSLDS